MQRRLRILTWHVHGNYLYNLTQVPHDFYLLTDADRSTHHTGRSGVLPWGSNVHEAPVEHVKEMPFDVIMFQSREAYEDEQHRILSAEQLRLPKVYLEHDPPQEHPTDTLHWVQDPNALLVHVTPFNALMWHNGVTPTQVIEHGVLPLSPDRYRGDRQAGLVVVNNLDLRGRRLGADIYEQVKTQVPLTLVGMGAERMGGAGEVVNHQLPATMASHRFFFNPIRYTSLGLSIIEAMMVGMPIVGLATTELVSVIRNGENGFIDTRVDRLVDAMHMLLKDPLEAKRLGEAARETALERFNIDRFVNDWLVTLRNVTA
ncbi:MAG: glycosyltransferase family 1 protein [Rubrivivax sp.]|nr:MAG: glycosyltransferase family 1 protein [Rubrivivax sp.]